MNDRARSVDAVVVLGAALTAEGRPTPALERRVRHGVRMLERHPGAILVMSGGGRGPRPEAEAMAEMAMASGVASDAVLREIESTRTLENAAFTMHLLAERKIERIALVTDPHHMPRALRCFRRFGIAAHGEAVPDAFAGTPWPKAVFAWARETAAFLWYLPLIEFWKRKHGR